MFRQFLDHLARVDPLLRGRLDDEVFHRLARRAHVAPAVQELPNGVRAGVLEVDPPAGLQESFWLRNSRMYSN